MTQRMDVRLVSAFLLLAVTACSGKAPEPSAEVVVTEKSFRCIRDLTPVRGFFVDNLLGDVEATVTAAKAGEGAIYPPGSLVQVIPSTAMVKHRVGSHPATNDWEFIELDVKADGVTFLGRGHEELNMRNGLNCLTCHQPAKAKWDLICDQAQDCLPIPLSPVVMRGLQNTDPRCPKIELPPEQAQALAEMAANGPPEPPR